MDDLGQLSLAEFVARQNRKRLLTPGPAALALDNLIHLGPFFGRGDQDYQQLEERVLAGLRVLSGHQQLARLQGSASLALEIAVNNFVYGRVLLVNSGYYAQRLLDFCLNQQRRGKIEQVEVIEPGQLPSASHYHWIVACYVETSRALLLDVPQLASWAGSCGAKLFLDATASIGLESEHQLADVIAYSSCKGLCGLTGASFVAFNAEPEVVEDSFYLNIHTHLQKRMTGPYHSMASLAAVLPHHQDYRQAVINCKQAFSQRFSPYLTHAPAQEPLLCTHISRELGSDNPDYVYYHPRSPVPGSIVCHLGEVHLGTSARGAIYHDLYLR